MICSEEKEKLEIITSKATEIITTLSERTPVINMEVENDNLTPNGNQHSRSNANTVEDDSVCGSCVSGLIYVISMILIILTFPFSLCVCIRMVQVSKNNFFNYPMQNVDSSDILKVTVLQFY